MYRASTLKIIMLLSILTLIQTTTPFATEIDHRKMRRDLDIAEEALKRILQYQAPNIKSPTRLETDQIRSTYLKDYGVVFLVNTSTAGKIFQIGDRVKLQIKKTEDQNQTTARMKKMDVPFSEDGKKARLTEFFQTYAQTIGQLKDTDKITVVLNTQIKVFHVGQIISNSADEEDNKNYSIHKIEEFIHKHKSRLSRSDAQEDSIKKMTHLLNRMERYVEKEKSNTQAQSDTLMLDKPLVRVRIVSPDSIGTPDPVHFSIKDQKKANTRSILQASIRKGDLNKYQKNGLSDEKFNAKINFQTLPSDTTIIKKIDIFSGIIDKSLGPNQESPLNINNKTLGTYIPNLGAFFFTTNNPETQLHTNDPITLKNTLIETLADYGSTLRDLKPNEEVIVHVHADYPQYAFHHAVTRARVVKHGVYHVEDFTQSTPNEFPKNLILRVQKKYLTNYTTGKINLEQLRNKITITDH